MKLRACHIFTILMGLVSSVAWTANKPFIVVMAVILAFLMQLFDMKQKEAESTYEKEKVKKNDAC